MRVEPSGSPSPLTPTTLNSAPRTAGKPAEATGTISDAGAFAPTGELVRFLDAVRQTPDVRSEVVQEAAAKVASGELHTPEAAADTARVLLASGEIPAQ